MADSVNFPLRRGEVPLQTAERWLSRELKADVKLQHAHGDRFTALVNGSPQQETVQIKVHMKKGRAPAAGRRASVTRQLAKRWGVSESEALRRVLDQAFVGRGALGVMEAGFIFLEHMSRPKELPSKPPEEKKP